MHFRPITIEDKALFERYLKNYNHQLITYSFANFFMWRDWDPYTWAEIGNSLVVTSNYLGRDTICVPIADSTDDILAATESMIDLYRQEKRQFVISEVSEADLQMYSKAWSGRFRSEEFPAGANYIYSQEDLALLQGKRYAAKRNHINKFRRSYPDYQFLPLEAKLLPGCLSLLDKWLEQHDASQADLEKEYQGSADGIKYYQEIGCDGAAILVNGQVVAFTIGAPLSKDTYAIHIEKADIDIQGAYQAINCFFASEYTTGFKYINRAEDMGEPGLKRAKESYYPCLLAKRYYLSLA